MSQTILRHLFAVLLALGTFGAAIAQVADLSLALSQADATPARYTAYLVVASVTNAGPTAATGVVVNLPRPDGVVFVGGGEFVASQGSYRPYSSRDWTVGTLAAGQTATLTLNLFLLDPTAPDYYGQVVASSASDPDSTPGNGTPGAVNEDDEASVQRGTGGGAGTGADLSLAFVGNPDGATIYERFQVTLSISNAGPARATGVVVSVPFAQGMGAVYVGGNESVASQGSHDPYYTQVWSVGDLAAGASATLQLNLFRLAGEVPPVYAQVTASNQADPDSTPGNGTPPRVNEDDEASTAGNVGGPSGGPCDAVAAYQTELAAPSTKITIATTPAGVVTLTAPDGSRVVVDGPAALGATIVGPGVFSAFDAIRTPGGGFAFVGAFREDGNPGANQPYFIATDASGRVTATNRTPLGANYDAIDIDIVGVSTSLPGQPLTIFLQARSFARSGSLAAITLDGTRLWAGQTIGDLVTNRIGGAAVSADGLSLYYSYSDRNSASAPRVRRVDAANGSTAWEVLLAGIKGVADNRQFGDVSAPFPLPDNGVALNYYVVGRDQVFRRVFVRLGASGALVYATDYNVALERSADPLVPPVYAAADGTVLFLDRNVNKLVVVASDGTITDCGNGSAPHSNAAPLTHTAPTHVLAVSPNPAARSQPLHINLETVANTESATLSARAEVVVSDAFGRTVYTRSVDAADLSGRFDMSGLDLTAGWYIIRVVGVDAPGVRVLVRE